ncbi:hypothetical protein, partial [Gordonibacter urolithinfaciens]
SVLRLREEGKAQTAMATVRNPHLHDLCKTGGEVFTYENSIYVTFPLYNMGVYFARQPAIVDELLPYQGK